MANDLMKGLSILYDMELNNYMMDAAVKKLNHEISQLGFKRKVSQPKLYKAKFAWGSFFKTMLVICILFSVYGAYEGFTSAGGIISGFFKAIAWIIAYFIAGAVISVAFVLVFFVILYIKDISYEKKENSRRQDKHNDELNNIEWDYQRQLDRKDALIRQKDILVKKRNESAKVLERFYNSMRIDYNYRNLIPIGYMYELCRLGISNKLTGTDGLYYLVRQELRGDRLQYTLEEISYKLDTIINQQSYIYQEITAMNSKCDTMIAQSKKSIELAVKNNQSIQGVVNNTSISNYHLQRIRKEAEFQNTMKMIRNTY